MVSYLLNEDRGSCPSCLKGLLQGNSWVVQWLDSTLSLLKTLVQSLVGELTSCELCGMVKKKKAKKKKKVIIGLNEIMNVDVLRCCSNTRYDCPLYLEILDGSLSVIFNYTLTLTIHYPGCQTQNKKKQTYVH